jgi:hypothetical protein
MNGIIDETLESLDAIKYCFDEHVSPQYFGSVKTQNTRRRACSPHINAQSGSSLHQIHPALSAQALNTNSHHGEERYQWPAFTTSSKNVGKAGG